VAQAWEAGRAVVPPPSGKAVCSVCGAQPAFKCSTCTKLGLEGRGAYFCGRVCQKQTWSFHKKFHRSEEAKLQDRARRMDAAGVVPIDGLQKVGEVGESTGKGGAETEAEAVVEAAAEAEAAAVAVAVGTAGGGVGDPTGKREPEAR